MDKLPRTPPGPIDNASLFQKVGSEVLRSGMSKRYDYRLVSEPQWLKLVEWYGGGPEAKRHVISIGSSTLTKVEVYLLNLNVVTTTVSGRVEHSNSKEVFVSRRMLVGEFLEYVCELAGLDVRRTQLWNHFSASSKYLMEDPTRTLGEEGLVHGQTVLMQQLKKPSKKRGLKISLFEKPFGAPPKNKKTISVAKRRHRGCSGIQFWGTSSILNAVVQCLSNTTPFCEHILNTKFNFGAQEEANLVLAQVVMILKRLWSVEYHDCPSSRSLHTLLGSSVTEVDRSRSHIGVGASIFRTLLATLHESLPLYSSPPKPHMNLRGSSSGIPTMRTASPVRGSSASQRGMTEAEVHWEKEISSAPTIVSELFMGQQRVTRQCRNCDVTTQTFETITSFPIPVSRDLSSKVMHEIPCMRLHDPTPAIKYGILVEFGGTIAELKKGLSRESSVPVGSLEIVTIDHERAIYPVADDVKCHLIPKKHILIAYEVPEDVRKYYRLCVTHRKPLSLSFKVYGVPFLIFIKKDYSDPSEVYKKVWNAVKRIVLTDDELTGVKKTFKSALERRLRTPIDLSNPHFTLKFVDGATSQHCGLGSECAAASKSLCSGCPLRITEFIEGDSNLTIDWETAFRRERYLEHQALSVRIHHDIVSFREFRTASVKLSDCLRMYSDKSVVRGGTSWVCPNCEVKFSHSRKCEITVAPEILVLDLRRQAPLNFLPEHPYANSHSDIVVEFPLQLPPITTYDSSDASSASTRGRAGGGGRRQSSLPYELYSVLSLHQEAMSVDSDASAFCRNKNDRYWYMFKDKTVRRTYDLSKLRSKNTMMLFYRRTQRAQINFVSSLKSLVQETISSKMLQVDNAVLLFQHACIADAESLKEKAVCLILDNYNRVFEGLSPDALLPAEASLLCDIIDKSGMSSDSVIEIKRTLEKNSDICALCDRVKTKKRLTSCSLCHRLVCRRDIIDLYCLPCHTLVENGNASCW
eukprot:TRINITY_DN753_c0_g1_i1.p1 TRINITY_DN753_c0_g1~~TRINITY_DN753_c0_g1_i1.p1  ORF type:complete len:1056 (-),score=163.24 TRINITY_DN753_c0_g1_i1:633-3560(-)